MYTVYSVRQKTGTDFLLCATLLILDRKWYFFHILYIKEQCQDSELAFVLQFHVLCRQRALLMTIHQLILASTWSLTHTVPVDVHKR